MQKTENEFEMRTRSLRALAKMKEIESSMQMYSKKLNKNTIVSSNKKSNLERYEQ